MYTQMLDVLDIMMTLFTGVLGDASGSFFGVDGSFFDFVVQSSGGSTTQCTPETCPGSFYTAIATAWANIGYVTHADVLRFLNTSRVGQWAILLYIAAAITGLIGVATNSPMRNYTWFFIGPALYSFLVGTTMQVQGVNWVVANKAVSKEGMAEVWRNAEVGLQNTRLAIDGQIEINGKYGPVGKYEVAMPMVFLDELFSATSNLLIQWTGIGNQVDGGGAESNLHADTAGGNGLNAWWLMANSKWGYLENITSNTIRNPDLRDAFITFLASECGDRFKDGMNDTNYIAATQAKGKQSVPTVLRSDFADMLDYEAIATPRSLARLYKSKQQSNTQTPGTNTQNSGTSFIEFSPRLDKAVETGRTHQVVCAEYLWTIIQGFRHEAGNAYFQMHRSAPAGFNERKFDETLLYGWDITEYAQQLGVSEEDAQKGFLKHLIMAYILRNELIMAPQVTTVNQQFAPAEQAQSLSEANIRSYGAKAKFIEVYNAAVMMPYLQGILAYFLLVSYPIACMLVILPGHYKGFFTWVSFFAWIKLWDVGFAMVHVLERSVWAMVGNHEFIGATAKTLIKAAKDNGGVGVSEYTGQPLPTVCSLAPGNLEGACPGGDQDFQHAYDLFDKLLLTSANLDLDISNGWYIYIMSALYLAVPAITGQLVLGAKAGSAGLIKDAFHGVASDGSQAAKTGAQHKDVNALTANSGSLGQAASIKAMRASGFAAQALGLKQQQLQHGLAAANLDNKARAHSGLANQLAHTASDFDFARSKGAEMLPHMGQYAVPGQGLGTALASTKTGQAMANSAGGVLSRIDRAMSGVPGYSNLKENASFYGRNPYASSTFNKDASGGAGGGAGGNDSPIYGDYKYGGHAAALQAKQVAGIAGSRAAGFSQDAQWQQTALSKTAEGQGAYAGTLSDASNYDSQMASWEARNAFGAHASAMAGIAGMNAGSLGGGPKPTPDAPALGLEGALGKAAQDSVMYAGNGFLAEVKDSTDKGMAEFGWGYVDQYRATGILDVHGASMGARINGDIYVAGARDGISNAVSNAVSDPLGTFMNTVDGIRNAGASVYNAGASVYDAVKDGSSAKQVDSVMPIKKPEPKKGT